MVIYEFENKWHKNYITLLAMCIFFLFPMLAFRGDFKWDDTLRYASFGIYLILLAGMALLTKIKGEESFSVRFKTDVLFRNTVIYKTVAIAGVILIAYFNLL